MIGQPARRRNGLAEFMGAGAGIAAWKAQAHCLAPLNWWYPQALNPSNIDVVENSPPRLFDACDTPEVTDHDCK